jgi:predicted molibdopterin-dependent oxidoreductase YjgC
VDDAAVRQKFEQAWGVELAGEPGLPASEMTHRRCSPDALRACISSVKTRRCRIPIRDHAVKGFASLEFLVVQDIFLTENAAYADVVLPSASFAEKSGTFTCSERRVQLVRPALSPPGQARTDLAIFQQLWQRLGGRVTADSSAEAVFAEVAALWPALGGMTYQRLAGDGLQWPCPDADHPGTPFLYSDRFLRGSDGRALFTEVPEVLSRELPDEHYPLLLTTGRQLFHYHTGTMTRRSTGLDAIAPEAYVEIHPDDAGRLGIVDGELVRVCSRRGAIEVRARVSEIVPPQVVFIPFHYAEAAANRLTNDATDPISKIMEAKVCAVRIELLPQ